MIAGLSPHCGQRKASVAEMTYLAEEHIEDVIGSRNSSRLVFFLLDESQLGFIIREKVVQNVAVIHLDPKEDLHCRIIVGANCFRRSVGITINEDRVQLTRSSIELASA